MRIIGGELRGRSLEAPPGRGTRPMLDRVRESMFGTLAPWIPDGRVLDLFAGSGSLGLEALSRGARSARLVERDAPVAKLLQRNVSSLGLEQRAEVWRGDALQQSSWGLPGTLDLVFLDPPYPMLREAVGRREILAAAHLLIREQQAPEGVLVLHVPRHALSPNDFAEDTCARERIVGSNSLWYVQRDEDA